MKGSISPKGRGGQEQIPEVVLHILSAQLDNCISNKW